MATGVKDKLVVLVGGGGFVGRYVAQALLKAGARIRIAQRDPRQAWFLRTQGGLGQTQFVGVDIAKPATVERAIAGADGVVNLVGVMAGDLQRIHVAGARAIAEAATAAGAKALVHVSAIGADAGGDAVYARTKGEGEAAVRAAFPSATILRPSIVFGPEDQFLNRFAGMIARLPVIPVLRAPARFQPVYVADVAAAVVASLGDAERFGGKTFELGGPDVLTMGALQRWIAAAIGRAPTFLELPDLIGGVIAGAGFLPGAPITADQWRMLQHDNVVADGAEGLAALDVTATPLEAVAPAWLVRFRRHGRFSDIAPA